MWIAGTAQTSLYGGVHAQPLWLPRRHGQVTTVSQEYVNVRACVISGKKLTKPMPPHCVPLLRWIGWWRNLLSMWNLLQNPFPLSLKIVLIYLKERKSREGRRARDHPPTGLLLKWSQWPGLGCTQARARLFTGASYMAAGIQALETSSAAF